MNKLLNKRNVIIGGFLACVGLISYRYLPVNIVGTNARIESLIDQLASSNSPPKYPGDPPHFYIEEFLDNPGDWDPNAQKPVSDAYYELKSIGKDAFPFLIEHFDDDRYSHERSFSTFHSTTVGDSCKFLIDEQVDPRGISYKSRESPNGPVGGPEVVFEAYVKSNYGSYAAWWRNNRKQSLSEMRIEFCNWRINKEKQLGFVDDQQKNGMLGSFNRMLNNANEPPKKLNLPPPDWYTVDAIVGHIRMMRQILQPDK